MSCLCNTLYTLLSTSEVFSEAFAIGRWEAAVRIPEILKKNVVLFLVVTDTTAIDECILKISPEKDHWKYVK